MTATATSFKDNLDYLAEQFARQSENADFSPQQRQEVLDGVLGQILKVVFNSHDIHDPEGRIYVENVLDRCAGHVSESDPIFETFKAKVSNSRNWVDYAANHAFTVK